LVRFGPQYLLVFEKERARIAPREVLMKGRGSRDQTDIWRHCAWAAAPRNACTRTHQISSAIDDYRSSSRDYRSPSRDYRIPSR
jgi:hypothetical protein